MSIASKYRPQFTYEDYCQWEGRWELIDGMPYAMSPSPVRFHQIVNGNLFTIFRASLKHCEKCHAYMPYDWKVNSNTVVQPDLFITCQESEENYLEFAPNLIIEILSPSTAFKDRHEKYELYEEQGVRYYIIVDPKFRKIEVYELIEGKYQLVATTPSTFEFTLGDCKTVVDFTNTWSTAYFAD